MPTQAELVEKAKAYLKEQFGEDTVAMDVTKNDVSDANGVLSVDCTVSVGGHQSDWSKKFYFRDGEAADMSARRR